MIPRDNEKRKMTARVNEKRKIMIATWNCCLGILHKRDIVIDLLNENNIDILLLQETEITSDMDRDMFRIKGYNFECEAKTDLARIACYIRAEIEYVRRIDLEKAESHLMILDIKTLKHLRLFNIYRSFRKHPEISSRDVFKNQLSCIAENTVENTIIMGDFNLDENKINSPEYAYKNLFLDMNEIWENINMLQLVDFDTWSRKINNQLKTSRLDHIYTNNNVIVDTPRGVDTLVGDHLLVITDVNTSSKHVQKIIHYRDWSNYTVEALVEALEKTEFDTQITPVQELSNNIERGIISAVDEIAPMKMIIISKKRFSPATRTLALRKRRLLQGNRTEAKCQEIKELNKKIKQSRFNQRRDYIRKNMKPGDQKSLWDSVSKSQQVEPQNIPDQMEWNGQIVSKHERANAFASEFKNKVEKIHSETRILPDIYNGYRKVIDQDKNFITENSVLECLISLKTKTCYGYDRIPLKVLKDGAQALYKPITVLLHNIYETKIFPEQWLISRIIPIHKKGNKKQTENYRPISNLCSLTKIFEKLMLSRILEVEEKAEESLTGDCQHGFKKNRSTTTAGLSIQSKLARLLDNNNFVTMASLDLSSAFDVVDHELLYRRLEIMGIPNDLIQLLRGWLTGRLGYVEVDGDVSSMFEIEIGVIQGSCLGPILYNLFVSPVFVIAPLESYADDSYSTEHDPILEVAIGKTEITLNKLVDWFSGSGLKVNKSKTEIIVFHKSIQAKASITVKDEIIITKNSINILGVTFDSQLSWDKHISKTISGSRKTLYAMAMIKKYFSESELKVLMTSLFYSKLFYASEIWNSPFIKENLKSSLLSASSQALRKIFTNCKPCAFTQIISNTNIHILCNRATPEKIMLYKLSLALFETINNKFPLPDWLDLNFTNTFTRREINFSCIKDNNYRVGLNTLSNRYSVLNGKIPLQWLNLPKLPYKLKCKSKFLNNE